MRRLHIVPVVLMALFCVSPVRADRDLGPLLAESAACRLSAQQLAAELARAVAHGPARPADGVPADGPPVDAPSAPPATPIRAATAADVQAMRGACDRLFGSTDVLHGVIKKRGAESDVEAALLDVQERLEELDAVLDGRPVAGGFAAQQHLGNVRWKVRRMDELLEVKDEPQEFKVGPVTAEQAGTLNQRVDVMMREASRLRAGLDAADPEMMYRNLLLTQLRSLAEPVGTLRTALSPPLPWWTPDAYQAMTQIRRLCDLTRNETRKLTPDLRAALEHLWRSIDSVQDAVDSIEGGARQSGPDSRIIYKPRPAGPR